MCIRTSRTLELSVFWIFDLRLFSFAHYRLAGNLSSCKFMKFGKFEKRGSFLYDRLPEYNRVICNFTRLSYLILYLTHKCGRFRGLVPGLCVVLFYWRRCCGCLREGLCRGYWRNTRLCFKWGRRIILRRDDRR